MSNHKHQFVFPLLILIVLLLTAVLAGGTAAQANVDEVLELSITKLSAEPVPVGEAARFGVKLRNISGQGVANVLLQLNWDDAVVSDARMRIVAEETADVRTDRVRRETGMVAWKGDMKAGGMLSIEIDLLARSLCNNENVAVELMGEAGPAAGEQRVTASAVEYASCQGSLAVSDVEVAMNFDEWVWPNGYPNVMVLAGRPAKTQLIVENKSDGRINALISAEITPAEGQDVNCLLLPAVQQRFSGAPTIPVVNSFFGSDSFTYNFMALEIDADTTWQGDLRVPMRGRVPGCEFTGEMVVYAAEAVPIPGSCQGESPECRYAGWSPREEDVQALFGGLPEWVSDPTSAVLVSPDLGDTPASENHFNIGMPPYGVDSGFANFPTVFNFNIGMPPSANGIDMDVVGPFHRDARPFRLGALASIEADADLNPGRNINPETGASNLDRRDDGLAAIEMPGSCEPLTMPVQITIEQWALDYFKDNGGKAYLNVFVDANGDGDWADAGQCGGETAPEHVVINHSMDMASAELGKFTVEMPANPGIMFETFRTWLRVSISEQPAPTPLTSGGIAHGDGRGPVAGYLLGETEDYRVRIGNQTNAVTQGADLAVRMDGFLTVESILPSERDLENVFMRPLTATVAILNHQASFGNLGDLPAGQSKLVVMPDPSLRDGVIELSVLGDIPWNGADDVSYVAKCAPSDPDCRVEIDLGSVPPGRFGTVNVTVTANCDPVGDSVCKKTDLVAKAMVQTAEDGNGNNNEAQYKWALPLFAELLAPPIINHPIPGTTSNEALEVQGVTWPGRTVIVGASGKKAGEDGDKDGPWKVTVAPKDGNYRIAASYELPGGKLNPTAPVAVVMSGGSTMLVDPMSMRVGLQQGGSEYTAVPWDNSGRVDPNGWQLPLIAGAPAEISMEPASWMGCLTCTLGLDVILRPLTATLMLPGDKLLTTLAVGEDDGILRGSFDVDSSMLDKPVTLNVYFEGLEQVYEGSTISVGKLPRVIDGSTGQPVKGAQVVLWQAAKDGDVDGADFLAWQRSTMVNGQPNPRITGSDGTFFFDVTPGRYRLEIIYDENSPSVWTDMRPAIGILSGDDIAIITGPATTANSKVMAGETVSISGDGFSPPFVSVSSGTEVNFQNLDLLDHGVHATAETMALLGIKASHADAPLIRPGGRIRVKFSQPGSYEFEDPQDPQNRMTVVVQPAGNNKVYLPIVMGN